MWRTALERARSAVCAASGRSILNDFCAPRVARPLSRCRVRTTPTNWSNHPIMLGCRPTHSPHGHSRQCLVSMMLVFVNVLRSHVQRAACSSPLVAQNIRPLRCTWCPCVAARAKENLKCSIASAPSTRKLCSGIARSVATLALQQALGSTQAAHACTRSAPQPHGRGAETAPSYAAPAAAPLDKSARTPSSCRCLLAASLLYKQRPMTQAWRGRAALHRRCSTGAIPSRTLTP